MSRKHDKYGGGRPPAAKAQLPPADPEFFRRAAIAVQRIIRKAWTVEEMPLNGRCLYSAALLANVLDERDYRQVQIQYGSVYVAPDPDDPTLAMGMVADDDGLLRGEFHCWLGVRTAGGDYAIDPSMGPVVATLREQAATTLPELRWVRTFDDVMVVKHGDKTPDGYRLSPITDLRTYGKFAGLFASTGSDLERLVGPTMTAIDNPDMEIFLA